MKPYTYYHPEPFQLESGEALPTLEILYHSSVEPSEIADAVAQGARVVWICHALTASSDPSDWWQELVGPGKCFDTDKDVVICANTIGSCYGTTGPASWGGMPLDFPQFSVRDLVAGHITLRKYLGIERLSILIGASVGGYQSLEWAASESHLIDNLILIACNERITPWQTAFNESQRMAIEADSDFMNQTSLDAGVLGLRAARTVALISYRSYEGYNIKQSEADEDCYRAGRASSYQRHQGQKLSDRFNAYAYYCMTFMLDTHNIGRHRGGVDKVLGSIQSKTQLIAIDSDILFPQAELESMAARIPGAKYASISSAFGHDGFLIEHEALEQVIGGFLGC